jgi:hypothetical protein
MGTKSDGSCDLLPVNRAALEKRMMEDMESEGEALKTSTVSASSATAPGGPGEI